MFNWHIGRLGALRQRNELLGALRLDGAGRYGAVAGKPPSFGDRWKCVRLRIISWWR